MKAKAVEALKAAAERSILLVTFLFFMGVTKDPIAMFRWLSELLIGSVGAVLFFSVVVLSLAYYASCFRRTIATDFEHSPLLRRKLVTKIVRHYVEAVVCVSYLVLSGYAAFALMRTVPEGLAIRVPGHFLPVYFLLCFVTLLIFSWIFQLVFGPRRLRLFLRP